MTDFLVSMAAGAAGAALFIAGFRWRPPSPPKDGLPCPHPLCRAMLPRMGLWNGNGYVVEACHVCGGAVLFNPYIGKGHDLSEKDNYIRFDRPELKP